MYVQVILGRAADAAAVRSHWERSTTDLVPRTTGFIGGTGGVTTDGRAVLIARFESEHASRASAELLNGAAGRRQ
jgi:hypothetical protein